MQSSNVKEIKAALYNQAFIGAAQVSCPMGQVVAIRKAKGQLKALVRGWGHWQVVESVTIDITFALPHKPHLTEAGPLKTEDAWHR